MASAPTYTPIATQTLGTATGSITFSSIPSTYTDLRLVVTGKTSDSSGYFNIYINGDSSNTWYSRTYLYGNGSSAGSNRSSNTASGLQMNCATSSMTVNDWPVFTDFMNYANTSIYKTALARSGNAATQTEAWAWLYRSTSAISSLVIQANTNSWADGRASCRERV